MISTYTLSSKNNRIACLGVKMAIVLFICCFHANVSAQVVFSRFDFNSNSLKTATIGPDATSINSDTRQVNGKLYQSRNCGNNTGFDLVIPNENNMFDVPSIGMRFSFKKSENFSHFFDRSGMSFYEQGGLLFIRYRTENGITPNGTVNYGPIATGFAFPNDNQYHEYSFEYVEATGLAEIRVDNNIVWSFDGPDNRALSWNSNVDPFLFDIMDGTCDQEGVLDFAEFWIPTSNLPVEYLSISATWEQHEAKITWETTQEINNDYFVVERSADQAFYEDIQTVSANLNNPDAINHYEVTDSKVPAAGTYWYRFRQVDNDGSTLYSEAVRMDVSGTSFDQNTIYPNPNNGNFSIKHQVDAKALHIVNMAGRTVYQVNFESNSGLAHDIRQPALPNGTYCAVIQYPGRQQVLKFIVRN